MVITSPLMLLGLLAVPAVAAIYWLRSRSRRVVVSSVDFWLDPNRPRQGGRILHRMQTPLCLLLELLALAMLALAAAGPVLVKRDVVRPLIVVLDDSYSMLALAEDGPRSARDRAKAALSEELARCAYTTRFVVAGVRPRLVAEPLREPSRLDELLGAWTCQSPAADLAAAVALASEIGGPAARILVLTDRVPSPKPDAGKIQWWAFGVNRPNAALTAASRTASGGDERVLLEISWLADAAGQATLTLEGGDLAKPQTDQLMLRAGASRQITLSLPAGCPPLKARLSADALAIDNEVVLLPAAARPLRVLVNLGDANLRRAVSRALEATGQTRQVADRPDLIVTDQAGQSDDATWRWEIVGRGDAPAYTGPFIIDRGHPLTQGLSLQDAIWSAASSAKLSGSWIVSAGNIPLITERIDAGGRRRLQVNLVGDRSTLLEMPDWPILVTNVVHWRQSGLPGPAIVNARLGQTVSVAIAKEAKRADVVWPDASVHACNVHGRRVDIPAERVGLYSVRTPEATHRFACNAVSRDESNLADCRSGRWGDWNRSPDYQDRQVPLGWICLLVVVVALGGHMALITRSRDGTPA
ncbi:MAG: BatA domain-containing protein [Thermoguttaceae bacterium]